MWELVVIRFLASDSLEGLGVFLFQSILRLMALMLTQPSSVLVKSRHLQIPIR